MAYYSYMRRRIVLGIVLVLVVLLLWCVLLEPSNERDWTEDQRALPSVTFRGDEVYIENIRNFSYESTSAYTPGYYNAAYHIDDIQSVDFIVVPFEGIGAAHTMLSFGFKGDRYLTISVEIRKEVGESFSGVRGLFNQYELMYVIADERDVIDLRANHRKNEVYIYPVDTTKEKMKSLFVDMLTRAESLRAHPEFYNTITNNCTIAIANHVNALNPDRVPWNYTFIFPRNADEYAHELGLIGNGMTLEEMRAKYRINDRAQDALGSPNFSTLIRSSY